MVTAADLKKWVPLSSRDGNMKGAHERQQLLNGCNGVTCTGEWWQWSRLRQGRNMQARDLHRDAGRHGQETCCHAIRLT
jgi:hypothetical protein